MNVYIPTYRRLDHQVSWAQISPEAMLKYPTQIVCPADEEEHHAVRDRNVLVTPVDGNIHTKRQWIVDQSEDDKVLLMDDDLIFLRRITAGDWHLRRAEPEDVTVMLQQIDMLLDYYPMVGVSARQGNQRTSGNVEHNTRICTCWAVRKSVLVRNGIRLSAQPLMDDFHVNLSLLKLGYQTALITEFAWNQNGASNAPGGCQIERGAKGEGQTQAAENLARLHPKFVKVVQKETKSSWGDLKQRTDVRIQWQKAYAYGLSTLREEKKVA